MEKLNQPSAQGKENYQGEKDDLEFKKKKEIANIYEVI